MSQYSHRSERREKEAKKAWKPPDLSKLAAEVKNRKKPSPPREVDVSCSLDQVSGQVLLSVGALLGSLGLYSKGLRGWLIDCMGEARGHEAVTSEGR